MLRISTPWDSQPQEAAELAGNFRWDLLVNQATPQVDLARGSVFSEKGAQKVGVSGRYLDTVGANNLVQTSAPLPGSTGYTALWVGTFTQASQTARSVLRTTGGGFRLEPYTTGGGQYVSVTHTGVAQLTGPAPYTTGFNDYPVIVLVNYDGTTASIEVMHYADGYSITNTTVGWAAATGTIDLSSTSGGLGSYLIGYAARPMPAAMRRSLLDNLYGTLFAPRSIWVPVSAGGGTTHDTTGALTGAGSTVAGSAAHIAIHGTSGALAGPGSSMAGASARTRAHPTSGALTGPGSAIAGTAAHVVPGGTHDTTGALTGPGASIAGTAAHIAKHSTSGALAGQGAAVSGTAARVAAAVTHDTSGVLTGPGAVISGQARGPDIVIADTHDGFWSREWYRLKKREEKKPTIAEVVEIVKESPQVLEVVRTEVQRKYPRVDYAAVRENVTLQRFIAKQLIEAAEEEDDIEAMLLLI